MIARCDTLRRSRSFGSDDSVALSSNCRDKNSLESSEQNSSTQGQVTPVNQAYGSSQIAFGRSLLCKRCSTDLHLTEYVLASSDHTPLLPSIRHAIPPESFIPSNPEYVWKATVPTIAALRRKTPACANASNTADVMLSGSGRPAAFNDRRIDLR